jgi:hypothetical protein
MLRLAVLVVAVLVEVGLTGRAMAGAPKPILAAGNGTLASIDMNDNGVPDESGDCNIFATAQADGSGLVITGEQLTGDKARPCEGQCFGSGFVSPGGGGFGEAIINSCDYAGAPFVPLLADFCSSLSSCLSGNPTATGGGPAGFSAPVLTAGAIFRVTQSFRAGFGQLCSAGGPAAEITGEDGVKVLRNFFPYPDAQNATHMCVSNVPVQVESMDGFVFKTACVPVSDGFTPLAFAGEEPFAIIPFVGLLPCGEVRGAPTANEWGLISLMAALLGLGVWGLGRRRSFSAGLPLP